MKTNDVSNRFNRILMGVLVIVMNAGFIVWAGANDAIENRLSETRNLDRKSSTEVFELPVGRESSSVILTMRAGLTDGALRARVFDSSGKSQGSFELTTKNPGEPARGRFAPDLRYAPGVWKLRIDLRDATGQYEFDWATQ